ncbi:hypothetical protein DPMN_158695 [Dreissena polymorpha]|uniref:Uncharacterized protein n=1 Tax=Dreissena polymorpha TaxID=45954 RepID=A0A9D4EJL2_DREPO|nr:hypothetical protein DPMN_158695 [Dreissena polymorpha]
MKAFTFEQQQKKLKETKDAKEEEWGHKKSQVFICGQTAVTKRREAFETLYSSLNLHVGLTLLRENYFINNCLAF